MRSRVRLRSVQAHCPMIVRLLLGVALHVSAIHSEIVCGHAISSRQQADQCKNFKGSPCLLFVICNSPISWMEVLFFQIVECGLHSFDSALLLAILGIVLPHCLGQLARSQSKTDLLLATQPESQEEQFQWLWTGSSLIVWLCQLSHHQDGDNETASSS